MACYLTWKRKATKSGRLLYQLAPSTPRTGGIGFGLWPTPVTSEAGQGKDPKSAGRGKKLHLEVKLWPTPQARDHFPPHTPEYIAEKKAQGHGMRNLNDEVKLWPTPRASSAMNDSMDSVLRRVSKAGMEGKLDQFVALLPTPTANRWDGLQSHGVNVVEGSLNPDWVERLMGYEEHWTNLEQKQEEREWIQIS